MEGRSGTEKGMSLLHILLSSNTQWVLFSTLLLGSASGMMGCLAYWKRQSLMSDALSHAALPGIVITFMLIGHKHLLLLILGAAVSALLGALLIQWVTLASRIKEDAAMGIVLSVFFGLGIMLLTIVNRTVSGNQGGLDSFIFGQAATMVRHDVQMMLLLTLVVIAIVVTLFKEWKLFLFDPDFARGIGMPLVPMNILYTFALVLTIVMGIQAVGVILMSALLIIPAVSARYWTRSFGRMIILSSVFGGLSGAVGTIISALGKGWPTGPFIVIVAVGLFVISILFGTQKGWLIQRLELRENRKLAKGSIASHQSRPVLREEEG